MRRLEWGQDDKREGVVVWTCLNMLAIPRMASVGKEGEEGTHTRLCVAVGRGEGLLSLGLWGGGFRVVGLDGVEEGLAGAHGIVFG